MTSSATVLLSAASELGGRGAGAVEGLAVLSAPLSFAAALMRDLRLSETAFVNTAGKKMTLRQKIKQASRIKTDNNAFTNDLLPKAEPF